MKCEDCIEWEYFEGYGYGCFCMKTMTPIDAEKCEFYADKRPDVPHSWKPSKTLLESEEEKWKLTRDEILKLVDKVKASASEDKEFIVYGTEEYINQVKDYLPPNISVKIVPANIIPVEETNPLKFVFEENEI